MKRMFFLAGSLLVLIPCLSFAKMSGPIKGVISPATASAKVGGIVPVDLVLRTSTSFQQVEVRLSLPDGLALVSGKMAEEISNFVAGKERTLSYKFRVTGDGEQRVVITAKTVQPEPDTSMAGAFSMVINPKPAATSSVTRTDSDGVKYVVSGAQQKMLPTFVDVRTVIPSAVYDIRYFGSDNFVGSRIDGYNAAKCILTRAAASALAAVEKELEAFGLKLRIYDCYRPQMAVDHFVRWASDMGDEKMKREFYPRVPKQSLFKEGYIAAKSGHTRGSTLDVTIDGLNMGTHFDFFGIEAHTEYPKIGEGMKVNRLLLRALMEKHGFANNPLEWWHYTLAKEPYPDKYFNFPVE